MGIRGGSPRGRREEGRPGPSVFLGPAARRGLGGSDPPGPRVVVLASVPGGSLVPGTGLPSPPSGTRWSLVRDGVPRGGGYPGGWDSGSSSPGPPGESARGSLGVVRGSPAPGAGGSSRGSRGPLSWSGPLVLLLPLLLLPPGLSSPGGPSVGRRFLVWGVVLPWCAPSRGRGRGWGKSRKPGALGPVSPWGHGTGCRPRVVFLRVSSSRGWSWYWVSGPGDSPEEWSSREVVVLLVVPPRVVRSPGGHGSPGPGSRDPVLVPSPG